MELFLSYLDPGTGSVIIQAMIGAVAGVGIFGRNAIKSAKYKAKNLTSSGSKTKHAKK